MLPLLVLTWVIYLALPFSLYPSFVVLTLATLFALSVAVTGVAKCLIPLITGGALDLRLEGSGKTNSFDPAY